MTMTRLWLMSITGGSAGVSATSACGGSFHWRAFRFHRPRTPLASMAIYCNAV